MNDSRVKCELLEQSLRVLAQENLDMEAKKLHQDKHKSNNIDAEPESSELRDSTEEDIVGPSRESDDDSEEEFFDIGTYFLIKLTIYLF